MARGKGKVGTRSHFFSCVCYALEGQREPSGGPCLRGAHRGAFGFAVERQILRAPKCSDEKHAIALLGIHCILGNSQGRTLKFTVCSLSSSPLTTCSSCFLVCSSLSRDHQTWVKVSRIILSQYYVILAQLFIKSDRL